MSILNRPSQGQPSVLVALAKTIWASENQSLTFDHLLNRAAPPSLTDQKQARGALNSWLKLGLFTQAKNGEISIANALPSLTHFKPQTLAWLRAATRQIAFRPKNNDPFWATKHRSDNDEDSTDGLASDLTRGTAWLLAQNLDVRLATHRQAESLAGKQLGNSQLVLQNDTRWKPLVDWMLFLGLGLKGPEETPRVTEENPSVLFIDPTEAISDLLPEIFADDLELPQGDFLHALARMLPVVDGGAYRQELEKQMTSQWSGPAKGRLSPALSRALLRLESSRKIKLLEKSDAGHGRSDAASTPIELWFGAKETRKVTHISFKKGSK
jgi:hypothetical protein